jgi:serine/threonine protein kinase
MYESPAVDPFRADIFALGITLFQLTSGRLPYRSDDVLKTVEIEWPEAFGPEFTSILKGMLEKNPADRPSIKKVAASQYCVDVQGLAAFRRRKSYAGFGEGERKTPLLLPIGHAVSAFVRTRPGLVPGIRSSGKLRSVDVLGPSKLAGLIFRTPKRVSEPAGELP